ncbi:UNVERIFIED_CONTAM: AarF domain-containing protein kinase [Sesamum angustifolium]|uniref:AarF domain-containing protein kinase n=1 Tax=Sesamum angustifolium TaxID=2727405 RepID=A0AAW2MIH4_9LAMI
MGWGNIYKRRVKVFSLAILIYIDYKVLQHREKWTKNSKRADLWDKAHERNARRVLKLIVKLEGLWVKLGQYLSTRADVLPPAYIRLLKQLQDSLPPRPLKEVCQTITTELGKSMADLFLNFDNTPLATASIAQVHRATLADGKEVVVKVQHEGIKEIILEDLKNAKSIVDWIAWAEPQYDFNPMIDEWCKEAPKELDFNHEAENTRKVSRNLGCKSNCDDNNINRVDVLIPEVITSSEKVLILEYMDGVRLNDSESLQALGVDKQKLVEEITRAYAHQIYVDGFFNGDPHPGNFLVSKAPPHRPVLLDFGLTKKLSFPMKQALAKMFLASAEFIAFWFLLVFTKGYTLLFAGDHVALLSSFAEMGLKLRLDIPEQVMEISSVFFRNSTPANEAHQTMKSFADRRTKNLKVLQEKMKLNEKEVKRFNPVISLYLAESFINNGCTHSLRGIMRPFAESVLQCNVNRGPAFNANWIHDTPVLSDVENKLRKLLIELGNTDKVLGIQELQQEWFTGWVDKGKLKLEDKVANIWPEFGSNGKTKLRVHHVLKSHIWFAQRLGQPYT